MAYQITLTDGQNLGSIADGTYNNTATSLTLVGRNFSNYGQIMVDDFVHSLENFSFSSAPSNPIAGQLWYNNATGVLSVYTKVSGQGLNQTEWKPISGATAQATAPNTTTAGDLWWDSSNYQLSVYNGTAWTLVGPTYPQAYVTGAVYGTVLDIANVTHYVIFIYANNTITAIVSADAQFTINTSAPVTGFSVINPGYNMANGYSLWGTANNSSYLGGLPASGYWYYNQNNYGTGSLQLASNVGITLGTLNNMIANVHSTTGSAQIWNFKQGANISLHVTTANGSVKSLAVNGQDGLVYVTADPTGNLGVTTKQYVDNKFTNTVLSGVPTAPNPSAGDNSQQLATTHFVTSGLSGLYSYKIYTNNTWVWTDTASINVAVAGTTVATASASGFNLTSGATAVTQSDSYNGSGNSTIATTQFVKNANQWWGGSAKFISNAAPNPGVNDIGSNNGDFWFQIAN